MYIPKRYNQNKKKVKESKKERNNNTRNRNTNSNENQNISKLNNRKSNRKLKSNSSNQSSKIKIVAQHAPAIPEQNIGNIMLRNLGWVGGSLGTTQEGIVDPIIVAIKNDKRGLGF
eukprot:TRINITY_DN6558_c0_g1_i2.p1 TRINITY_DN6558_c0_g1~~TRINITY_DN6558_c0_g1_i2.p1  ORF type:complete len:116 (-),score=45.81 TRINITY_DN6558_c0_g1_i2:30-377(-)